MQTEQLVAFQTSCTFSFKLVYTYSLDTAMDTVLGDRAVTNLHSVESGGKPDFHYECFKFYEEQQGSLGVYNIEKQSGIEYQERCFSSVQSLSHVWLFATPWIAAHQASLSISNSWSSLKLTSIKLVMASSHLILCHPLLLLPSIPPSIRVFSNESTLRMRWPKYWSFSFSMSRLYIVTLLI